MRVTKFEQSCLAFEKESGRILVDPGRHAMDAGSIPDVGAYDAVLYTHRHSDHFDSRYVDHLVERGVQLYGNDDVCALIDNDATLLQDGKQIDVAGFEILPRDLPHFPMVDGSPGPKNTGFVIDNIVFHPGDGIQLENLRVDFLAAPIAGPSISFRDAYIFTQESEAKTVLPIHYDAFIADPNQFEHYCDIADVVVLEVGEYIDYGNSSPS